MNSRTSEKRGGLNSGWFVSFPLNGGLILNNPESYYLDVNYEKVNYPKIPFNYKIRYGIGLNTGYRYAITNKLFAEISTGIYYINNNDFRSGDFFPLISLNTKISLSYHFKQFYMKKIIYLICLVSIFVSCVRTSEEPIHWNETSLPVVFSFITPDSIIKVLLTEISQGINKADTFPNAEVYIIDESNNQVLLTRVDSVTFADQYRKMNIYAGKTYQLKIDLKNRNSIITAHTTVPNISANFEKYTVTPTNQSNEFQKSAYFNCEWKIPAQNKQTDGYFLMSSWFGNFEKIKKDAQTYTVRDNTLYYPAKGDNYHVSLLTTDKWMNRYLINENAQSLILLTKVDLFVLFLPEYLSSFPNFSNIENGIGVFGSYLIHTRDLEGNVVK